MPEIRRSAELIRVRDLERRTVTHEEAVRRAAILTTELRRPGSSAALKPWQGYALWEAVVSRGAYLELPVGTGKTLVAMLAATCLGAKAPVLVVPPAPVADTRHLFAQYVREWRVDAVPHVLTYWDLTHEPNFREGERSILDRYEADLYILDEVHRLRNQDRSAPRRLGRDISRRNVPVIAMTGTGSRNTLLNYSHLLVWTLKDRAPVPLDPEECAEWAAALDEKPPVNGFRPEPDGLIELAPDAAIGEGPMARARAAFCDRLVSTPGVLIVSEDSCDQPLTITLRSAPEDPIIDAHFDRFRLDGETPDGRVIDDQFSRIAHGSWLGTGGYYRWVPPAPEPWREAYGAAARFVRRVIAESSDDRPLETWAAVERAYPGEPALVEWRQIKPTFTPNSVFQWSAGSVVFWAAEWAKQSPGLVWCDTTAVAEALKEISGMAYYGPKGRDTRTGSDVLHADPRRSHILSFDANLEGRNLQAWNRVLLIGLTTSALFFEQFLGRSHRFGQERPVSVEILITSCETLDAWRSIQREAAFVHATKKIEQKVLRAEIVRDIHVNTDSYRWSTIQE